MQKYVLQQFDGEELQQLLAANPRLLPFLIELNTKKEELELLDFIHREQQIMNSQLINQKIPSLLSNIDQLTQELNQRDLKVKELQFQIHDQQTQIQEYRKATQKQYLNTQVATTQMRKVIKDMTAEHTPYMQNQDTYSLEQFKKAIFVSYNKQNHSYNSNTKQVFSDGQGKCFPSIQITKLVQLRAENKIIQQRIATLTDNVRNKIGEVEKKKKERREKESEVKGKREEKGKSKVRNEGSLKKCIEIRKSIIGSQFISVESYLENE